MKRLIFSIILGSSILVSQSFAVPLGEVAKVIQAGGKAASGIIDAAKGQKSSKVKNAVITENTDIKAAKDVNLGVRAKIRNTRTADLNNTVYMKGASIKSGKNVNAGMDLNTQ